MFYLFLIGLLLFPLDSFAQIYEYVDKNGVAHFTDTPTKKKYQANGSFSQEWVDEFTRIKRRMRELADDVMNNSRKYNTPQMRAVSEMLPIVDSAYPTGTEAEQKFVEIVDKFIDMVTSKKCTPGELDFLVDRAKAERSMMVEPRPSSTPIHVNQPPPIVNVYK